MNDEMQKAHNLFIAAFEKEAIRLAQKAIRENDNVDYFIAGMGYNGFFNAAKKRVIPTSEISPELAELISQWDRCVKFTGNGWKITADAITELS